MTLTAESEQLTAEQALAELREMFPEIEYAVYDLLQRRIELHLPEKWPKYFSGTLTEAMNQVRKWYQEQQQ